jgi:hypothetical protein
MKLRIIALPLLALAVSDTSLAKPPLGNASTAVTDDILDAIAEEMNRSITHLKIGDWPGPYHISYKVTEVDVNDVVASLGHATTRKNRHNVFIEARVRVGVDPDDPWAFDNANFIVPGGSGIDGVASRTLPLEASGRAARRAAWQVTDEAYKEALMQLQAKFDARGSTTTGDPDADGKPAEHLASWTAEKPIVSETPVLVPELEPLEDMESRAEKLSALFRDQGHVRDSRVAITSYVERRWYINSEGTTVADTRRASGILIAATAQAKDGQELAQYFVRYGHTAGDLPTDDELTAETKAVTARLAQLQKAPLIKPYSGPVLFEGEGAVGMVRNTLAPHLGGTPLPEGLRPQDAKQFGGRLKDKVGLRVTSGTLAIVDDPTTGTSNGKAMIGGYKIDDEGVAAQRVEVVKGGMLKSLLTSRTPAQKGARSNGHARRTTDGGMFHGSATNLIVSAKGGVSRKALVDKLIAAARAEGLPYAIIIRQFDDAAITATNDLSRRELIQYFQSADTDLPPPASLAYRVYPNGKEELVRGVQLAEVPIRVWKDVIGAGAAPLVYNYLAAPEPYLANKVSGGTEDGAVPSSGIESAIVVPDLLFKELDVVPVRTGRRGAPAVASPVAAP